MYVWNVSFMGMLFNMIIFLVWMGVMGIFSDF